ncbi:MAG: hypothetical protein PHS44_03845 [Candidatus Dojkabacteria bacterium]|nr:hypothetical protein [Candidatus Dojkabacteria bacterium]
MEDGYEKKEKKNIYEQVKEGEQQRRTLSSTVKKGGQNLVAGILYYSLPLFSIIIFFLILFAGTVPAIKGIQNSNDAIEQKKQEISELDSQLASLEALKSNEGQMISDLAIIDKIVPAEKTQVAKFVGEISDLAETNELEETKYESGEQIEKLQEEIEEALEKETAAIINIPATSQYTATFGNIGGFLNALYKKNDFIIVSALSMQGGEAREYIASRQKARGEKVSIDTSLPYFTWTMKVTFEKYQFSKGFSEYIIQNLVPLDTQPNEEILQYIRRRYS